MDASSLVPTRSHVAESIRVALNCHLAPAGISITAREAAELAVSRELCLRDNERIELGTPAVVVIAQEIALSPNLENSDVADVLAHLQEAFYRTRDELSVEVPDSEIIEAICHCFNELGSAFDVATLPTEELMAFSKTYQQIQDRVDETPYCLVDDTGCSYTFDPAEWEYDEAAPGWNGEKWDGGIDE